MYLARYEAVEGGSIVQGVVRVVGEPVGDTMVSLWREQVRGLAAMGNALTPTGMSLRLSIHPDQPTERVLAVACPSEREVALTRWLAAFTRLERSGTARVETLRAAESHRLNEILIGKLPPRHARIADPGPLLAAGETWLTTPWRLRERLNDLARQALLAGHALNYVVHFATVDLDPETLRTARRNLLRLERVPGMPSGLLADQRARVDHFSRSCLTVDEYLAVADTVGAWEWLTEVVRGIWKPSASELRWSILPEIRTTNPDEEEALVTGMPVELLFGPETSPAPAQKIGRCAEPEAFCDLLGWISPDPQPAKLEVLDVQDAHTKPLRPAEAEPYFGSASYAFVSYSRCDAERIAPILDQLASHGVRVWYDSGIPGGVEWDAYIEERLEHCSVLLLFLSKAAAASRYVSREVKYADARGKILVPILLESADPPQGLRWILGPIQMIDAREPDLVLQMEQAIRCATRTN
ncbi:toll/interleukin-1 receptor domain-containing protein [Paracoccus sp. SSK6]|uniref:toll/interleukin-1 receptor domain-containing protein n=1 Tax=Paracoccus sp. SSK6 TaxID=3143131 RepID=UPI00321AE442